MANILRFSSNKEYALSLTVLDLPLINHVARSYINKKVGEDAPLWEKEKAYEEWYHADYDVDGWARARFERALKRDIL